MDALDPSRPQSAGGLARNRLPARIERCVGRRRGTRPGPTLLVVGAIHGNEPAGVLAAIRLLERLEADGVELRGELVCLAGNLRALRLGRRYVDRDLNRLWTEASLAALPARLAGDPDAEDHEQAELRDAIEHALREARGPVYALDLHTTSAAGFAFALYGDTLRQRSFAKHFPLPAILGLEEQVDGVLVEWLGRLGATTLCIEAGQHDDPVSVDNLVACLTVALAAAGLVEPERLPGHAAALAHLEAGRGGLPRVMEVLHRHPVSPSDGFVMEPGFANIARVRAGQLLARTRDGEIRAPRDGLLFLPLYQAQGSDGFFLGREVGRWRLRASKWLRRAGLDRTLPWLPGVRRTGRGDALALSPRAARIYPQELFTTFGYRRRRERPGHIELSRRPAG
ncbi:MAG: succinylglutamate desuccinylase/aspartoacylase family protein [Myxococcota bacterium]|nr:succinylglutamate desuccinylase/aspartoacylase family protein [Myxococcota bacterium]MDW8362133.1 succinylglutamate desuccinylase/aspartoacylase family protein [Myxococcales bacterium]